MHQYTVTLNSEDVYHHDGLISYHRHQFLEDPAFQRAYQRGVDAIGGQDFYHWYWRVHIGLWAAAGASRLDGDFVECGVNRGFMSSAVMEYLDWDRLGKTFYLLDTFAGIDPRFVTDGERRDMAIEKNEYHLSTGFYVSSADGARANFAQWRNQRIIVGAIPDTLDQVDAPAVAHWIAADAGLCRLIREGFECGIPGEQLAEASRSAAPHQGRRGAPLFVDGCGRADEPMHASHRPTEGVYGR